jgi:hypothetical protein
MCVPDSGRCVSSGSPTDSSPNSSSVLPGMVGWVILDSHVDAQRRLSSWRRQEAASMESHTRWRHGNAVSGRSGCSRLACCDGIRNMCRAALELDEPRWCSAPCAAVGYASSLSELSSVGPRYRTAGLDAVWDARGQRGSAWQRMGRRAPGPLQVRDRVEHASRSHGHAVSAAKGAALYDLLAALDDADHPPLEQTGAARHRTCQDPA